MTKFNTPSHYVLSDGSDSMELIAKILGPEEFKGFLRGNAIKYLIRYKLKGGIEDIKKKAIDETVRKVSREAFDRTVVLSLLVLRDNWGFGEVRMERFMDQLSELVEDVSEGRLSMMDITKTLEDELGLEFTWRR